MQQLRFSDIISSLSDPVIDEIFLAAAPHIKAISQELNVNYKYISIQARLLIPFYSKQEIQNSGSQCIKTILKQLHKPIISFNQNYQLYSKETGICTLPSELCLKFSYNQLLLENSSEVIPINFEKVQSDIGIAIQENLHYIHSARSDTKFHLGIFLPEKRVPLCYASFSICDRKYLAKALGSFLNLDIETHEIIVMTRAFSFIYYKNMMSKLFDLSAKNLKKSGNYRFIITALNPFLGFKGTSFMGASYIPFAISPMIYKYTSDGFYLNRRNLEKASLLQKYPTPPILWFFKSFTKTDPKMLESRNLQLYEISLKDYSLG